MMLFVNATRCKITAQLKKSIKAYFQLDIIYNKLCSAIKINYRQSVKKANFPFQILAKKDKKIHFPLFKTTNKNQIPENMQTILRNFNPFNRF